MAEYDFGQNIEPAEVESPCDFGEAPYPPTVSAGIAPRLAKPRSRLRLVAIVTPLALLLSLCAMFGIQFTSPNRSVKAETNPGSTNKRASEFEVRMLESARKSWNEKDYRTVIAVCSNLLERYPENSRGLLGRAAAFSMLDDWDRAIIDHQALMRIDPDLAAEKSPVVARAYLHRANSYRANGLLQIDAGEVGLALTSIGKAFADAQQGSALSVSNDPLSDELGKLLERCKRTSDREAGFSLELLSMRKWSDTSGKFSMRARFIEVSEGRVRLERSDGSRCSIELDKISPRDKMFLASHIPR